MTISAETKQALLASYGRMSQLLLGVQDGQEWRPAPGEWSFREIAAHMRQVEIDCFYQRIQRIANGESPHFTYYLNSGWDFSDLDLTESVADWLRWRRRTMALASRCSAEQLQLTGTHDYFGTVTVPRVLQIALEHDQEHIAHLELILQQYHAQ